MLAGVLAGPVGVLLGGSMGALAGGTAEVARSADQDFALDSISKDIEPGSTALVAEVSEYAELDLDRARRRGYPEAVYCRERGTEEA